MRLVPNRSSSHRKVTLAVCGVAPSCWNHSRSAPGEPLCSVTQKRFRMSTYRSLFTVCVCLSASSKKKGPIMPVELIAHHTVTLGLSGGASRTMSGALEAHTRQLCVFTCPCKVEVRLSLNQTRWRPSKIVWVLFSHHYSAASWRRVIPNTP